MGNPDFRAVRLIASDMDNTLLSSKGALPPHFDSYIERMDAAGITFVAASGRPLYTLEKMFASTRNRMAFISDNGGAIRLRGETLFTSRLDPARYLPFMEFCRAHTGGIAVLCGLSRAYIEEAGRPYAAYFSTFYSELIFVPDLTAAFENEAANKYTLYFPNANSKEIYDSLLHDRWTAEFSIAVSGSVWIDIMNHGVNKGQALRFLADHLGISSNATMAFGDTYNDREMLEAAAWSYLVANAHTDMRDCARFTCPSNDDEGVVQIIKSVLAERESA